MTWCGITQVSQLYKSLNYLPIFGSTSSDEHYDLSVIKIINGLVLMMKSLNEVLTDLSSDGIK